MAAATDDVQSDYRVEDLKAIFGFVEGEMAVAEDHRLGVRKAATQARQSAPRRAGVMYRRQGPATQLNLDRDRQGPLQCRLVDVPVNCVDTGAELPYLFEC